MTHLIKVINKNTFEIIDYFDGMPYKFSPDEAINVPLQAMRHIFGVDFPADQAVLDSFDFREEIFAVVARRWGWNAHNKLDLIKNRKAFNSIKFIPVVMQQVELVANSVEIAPARDQKKFQKAVKVEAPVHEPESDEEEVA